ncbi:MAG: hypothetical protein JRJ31_02425 [Deltaproteobacteria bacterium]|nr:hypothetical protein [Deltaproteobacteria bacterium]
METGRFQWTRRPCALFWILLFMLLFSFGCAERSKQQKTGVETPVPASRVTGLKPLKPQPNEADMEPGLKVWYFTELFIRRIEEMPQGKPPFSWGKQGKPIPYLNHHFVGENRKKLEVFDSGTHRGVAMYLWGMIRFPSAGRYFFKSMVNDGILVLIDEKTIIDDSTWGSDRFSKETVVEVSEPGWYPIVVKYFQRKGTARVHLFWKRPGQDAYVFVPPEAYAHLRTSSN